MEDFRKRKGVVETYRWMGWLYTVVGCFIVALLVLMFLDMSTHDNFDRSQPNYIEQTTTPIQGPLNTL